MTACGFDRERLSLLATDDLPDAERAAALYRQTGEERWELDLTKPAKTLIFTREEMLIFVHYRGYRFDQKALGVPGVTAPEEDPPLSVDELIKIADSLR